MSILSIKTDQEEAFVGLQTEGKIVDSETWQAGRELSMTLNEKLEKLLNKNNLEFKDLEGIVFYSGPGSFTGLRIGASVANTLAYSLTIPIVGVTGEDWQDTGIKKLKNKENDKIVKLNYGAEPNITKPRK
ncbi:MAG: tRNA (adenosine(37)-N6)-threonylcarbamoyltransferase complex dimerization subunit type 1 TsaB [Patescibacteria group bacterium]